MSQAVRDLDTPKPIYLADYRPPSHLIHETKLHFELNATDTVVRATLTCERNPESKSSDVLKLAGQELRLESVAIDGRPLSPEHYSVTDDSLELRNLPDKFTLETVCHIDPEGNKALMGLYMSRGIYCTQCESHGFRRITYYLDRPDTLSRFTTTIDAQKSSLPQLLSNGNLILSEDLEDGRHRAVWEDPFPKPAYLFALVAGDLACVEDSFTTMSGRHIELKIFVEHGNEPRSTHAMESLKKSMEWDEEVYGREYDLDLFMIVAVDDFNFGAMENKGLNIFNSRYVLADKESATDAEFLGIEGVVAHEYFHNWTGNRVTCRDWFQLTLKEGLTVFRDQEFSADVNVRSVKYIDVARFLRNVQFAEDASPTAHPIRPESYIEINNFYTTTVYQKGAAVIRMIHTLIGPDAYRKAMDLYFERHDGQAVCTEDFVKAMEDASGLDLTQFEETWYRQAGTPHCDVQLEMAGDHFNLHIKQSCKATPEAQVKQPFFFPFSVAFLDKQGRELPLSCNDKTATTHVLHVKEREQTFVFTGTEEKPLPSLLRDFSAPVTVDYPYTRDDLAFLFAHDTDPFNRYDAGQRLATDQMEALIDGNSTIDQRVLDAFASFFKQGQDDPAFCAECLALPSEGSLIERMEVCDFDAAHSAREKLKQAIADQLEEQLLDCYHRMGAADAGSLAPKDMGMRRLRNTCLSYLAQLPEHKHLDLINEQYYHSQTMTERYAALCLLCDGKPELRDEALAHFYGLWSEDPLIMNKFFTAQAMSKLPDTLERVKKLEKHAGYDSRNPNKIRSLVNCFAANLALFHANSGEGYRYIADKILEVDAFNHHVSGRLSKAFSKFPKLDTERRGLMRTELERILEHKDLSNDVYEVVSKTLGH